MGPSVNPGSNAGQVLIPAPERPRRAAPRGPGLEPQRPAKQPRSNPPGTFSAVPSWLMSTTGPMAWAMFAALGQYADSTRACWPSVRQLGADMGLKPSRTKELLAELVAAGAVKREPRYVECESGKRRQTSTRYRLAGAAGPGDFAPAKRPAIITDDVEAVPELLDAAEQRAWNSIAAAEPELAALDIEPEPPVLDVEAVPELVLTNAGDGSRRVVSARISASSSAGAPSVPAKRSRTPRASANSGGYPPGHQDGHQELEPVRTTPPYPPSTAAAESVRRLLGERVHRTIPKSGPLAVAIAAALDAGWQPEQLVAAVTYRELTTATSLVGALTHRVRNVGSPPVAPPRTSPRFVTYCADCQRSSFDCDCQPSSPGLEPQRPAEPTDAERRAARRAGFAAWREQLGLATTEPVAAR